MGSRAALVLSVIALIFLGSCTEQTEYFSYTHIHKGEWYRDSVQQLRFDSLPLNPSERYNIYIEITHNNSYPYRNLWLLVGQNLRDSVVRHDTVKFSLADSNGKWFGGSTGGLHQLSVPYYSDAQLDTAASYSFSIRQLMADDPLRGIEKIGIRIADNGR